MLISFAWTTPALLAGAKTMTRREWNDDYAARFKAGQLVDAWNQTPRVNSARRGIALARKVATIRITRAPYRQRLGSMTNGDYAREGFRWMWEMNDGPEAAQRAYAIWHDWQQTPDRELWVVEFELVEVLGVGSPAGGRPLEGETGAQHLSNGRSDHART